MWNCPPEKHESRVTCLNFVTHTFISPEKLKFFGFIKLFLHLIVYNISDTLHLYVAEIFVTTNYFKRFAEKIGGITRRDFGLVTFLYCMTISSPPELVRTRKLKQCSGDEECKLKQCSGGEECKTNYKPSLATITH